MDTYTQQLVSWTTAALNLFSWYLHTTLHNVHSTFTRLNTGFYAYHYTALCYW